MGKNSGSTLQKSATVLILPQQTWLVVTVACTFSDSPNMYEVSVLRAVLWEDPQA